MEDLNMCNWSLKAKRTENRAEAYLKRLYEDFPKLMNGFKKRYKPSAG